jgi:hypothetical protein
VSPGSSRLTVVLGFGDLGNFEEYWLGSSWTFGVCPPDVLMDRVRTRAFGRKATLTPLPHMLINTIGMT